MPKIFVNYRNGDDPYAAVYIYEALAAKLGPAQVFKSNSSIRPGEDSAAALLDNAATCDVLLAIIGPNWLSIKDNHGQLKLHRPDDWVRREIATALHNGRRVIPVLLTNARIPLAKELPSDLAALATLQYRYLHHRNAVYDITRLFHDLTELIPDLVTTSSAHVDSHIKADEVEGRAIGIRAPSKTRGRLVGRGDVGRVLPGGELIGVELTGDDRDDRS